jgi:uncharacterized protein YcnI
MRYLTLAAAIAVFLTAAAAAEAHVTVHPNKLPAGSFVVLNVRVPNESSSADTTKVEVQLPPGFAFVSTAPVPGWTAKVVSRKLAAPVTVDGEQRTSEGGRAIWSGGRLAPGEFLDFPLSVSMPDTPGSTLTFKAIQTYSDGKVVRWIGDAGSDAPAPQISVVAKGDPISDVPAGVAARAPRVGDDANSRAEIAIGLGIAAVLVSVIAFSIAVARRPSAP